MGAGPGARPFRCLLTASPSTISSVSPWWALKEIAPEWCLWLTRICLPWQLDFADEPVILLQVRKLKLQLEEERQKCSRGDGTAAGDLAGLQNGSDLQFIEMQSKCRRPGLCPRSGIVNWLPVSCNSHFSRGSRTDWFVRRFPGEQSGQ